MEMILKDRFNEKKSVDFKEGNITSIQSNYIKNILKNLSNDYSLIYINNNDLYFLGEDVSDEIELYNKVFDYSLILDILDILEVDNSFLKRKVDELSHTEKIYLNIIRNLSFDRKIVLFDDVFKYLDYGNQKKIKNLLMYLKEMMYVIIITSSDVNVLYKLAEYSVIWYKNFFEYGSCDDLYTNVEKLVKSRIAVPVLPLITYKAKVDKNVKLFYSKDVRDIIKDIYKHV